MDSRKKDEGGKGEPVAQPVTKDAKRSGYVNEYTMNLAVQKVIVHPLVLLSVVDHFSRQAKTGHNKRVVGVLLGTLRGKELDISNSFAGTLYCLWFFELCIVISFLTLMPLFENMLFILTYAYALYTRNLYNYKISCCLRLVDRFVAVPFDEDEKAKDVYFLDHDFLESMYGMFRRVNGI